MNDVTDTRSRILDVAEELFADEGLDRVSVRDITERAKVNLAAINYHFGGKEELITAVFERRVKPVNQARMEAIAALVETSGANGPQVEAILEAFIRPAVTCCHEKEKGGRAFGKLFGRCVSDPRPQHEALLKKLFEPLMEKLDAALMKSLPHLTRAEIYWRMKFTFGALHHWLLTRDKFVPSWAAGTSLEDQIQKLIAYATAGLKAKQV